LRVKAKTVININDLSDEKTLDSIIESLLPDNVGVEETTSIRVRRIDRAIIIEVEAEGKLGSFIHTIDDLLRCLSTSIRTLVRNP
jgi:hypothetical protein